MNTKRLHKSTVDAFIISESLLAEKKNLFTSVFPIHKLYIQFAQDIFINNIIMTYIAMIMKELNKLLKKFYIHCICTFGA